SDPYEVNRFLDHISTNKDRKNDLERLYELSNNVHGHKLCAPDEDSLKKMIDELDKKGFVLKNKK
ncbi:MAG: 3H domain-containing protein, partial [Methanobacterium sp.]